MFYLPTDALDELNAIFQQLLIAQGGDARIHGRMELYSCTRPMYR